MTLYEVAQNLEKIYERVDHLFDSLSDFDYEALIDTNYDILIRHIREAINASMVCDCTIPIEYENHFAE